MVSHERSYQGHRDPWVILGVFCLGLAFLALLFFFGVAQIPNVEDVGPGALRIIGILASSFLGLIGLPQIIGGLGLLQHKEWARILMLVVSFLSLYHVPFGTFLGVYSMIILFNPETIRQFQAGTAAPVQPAPRHGPGVILKPVSTTGGTQSRGGTPMGSVEVQGRTDESTPIPAGMRYEHGKVVPRPTVAETGAAVAETSKDSSAGRRLSAWTELGVAPHVYTMAGKRARAVGDLS